MTENPSDRPSSDLDRVPAEQRWRLQRVLPHPSSRIYQALMDPELLPHWYGPQGWSVHPESLELDPRPGGIRRFAMVMDDDPQMGAPSHGRHAAIVPEEMLEIQEALPGPDGEPTEHLILLRIELVPVDGGTRIELLQGPLPEEVHATAKGAWDSSIDRLRALLDSRES